MFTGQMEEKINNKELFEEQQENIILRFSFLFCWQISWSSSLSFVKTLICILICLFNCDESVRQTIIFWNFFDIKQDKNK